MRAVLSAFAIVCFSLAFHQSAFAQDTVTLEQALERARARAPDVIAARARVDEARARLLGASIRFRDNPSFDVDAGPRRGDAQHWWDFSISAGQTFETGSQRNARIASAKAEIDRAQASADESQRIVVRDVALAYVTALRHLERLRLLRDAEQFTRDLQTAAERRYTLGDIAALDLNLARIAAARATAERVRAESDLTSSLRPLRLALGLTSDAPLAVTGSLIRSPLTGATVTTATGQSPLLRAADAEIAQAADEMTLGVAAARPDVGVRVTAKREGGDRAILGGVTVTWPAFNRGQELRATSEARTRRVSLEREATSRLIQLDLDTGLEEYRQRAEAARLLREVALPAAEDNESLAVRSFDAGEINLMNLLLVRQDATTTRLAYIDAVTDAALTSIEVDSTVGVLR